MKKTILILGEGAWGTAIATVLAHNGHTVRLWCHDASVAQAITKNRVNNRYLPGIKLSEAIIPVTDFSTAGVDYIAEAIPVAYLRSVVEEIKKCKPSVPWIVLSKGIENETAMLPSQIIESVMGKISYAVLVGPSFAKDLAEKQLTAVALAATDKKLQKSVQDLFQNDYLRIYPTQDINGIQVTAALKNVIALAVGLIDGAGYGDNTRTFIFMRGLYEVRSMVKLYGGNEKTCYGLAGFGDTVMTALSEKSRNRECGRRFGAGEPLEKVLATMTGVVEGLNTLKTLHTECAKKKITLPFFQSLYQVFYERLHLDSFLAIQKEEPV